MLSREQKQDSRQIIPITEHNMACSSNHTSPFIIPELNWVQFRNLLIFDWYVRLVLSDWSEN